MKEGGKGGAFRQMEGWYGYILSRRKMWGMGLGVWGGGGGEEAAIKSPVNSHTSN